MVLYGSMVLLMEPILHNMYFFNNVDKHEINLNSRNTADLFRIQNELLLIIYFLRTLAHPSRGFNIVQRNKYILVYTSLRLQCSLQRSNFLHKGNCKGAEYPSLSFNVDVFGLPLGIIYRLYGTKCCVFHCILLPFNESATR